MAGEVRIRRARPDDAEAVAALSGELGYPASAGDIRERLVSLLAQQTSHELLVAEDAGRVVGWVHVAKRELLESGPTGEVLGLVVAGSHRQGGIGRRLVQGAISWAERQELDRLVVRSNIQRQESHPFYERLGFTRVKSQHVYRLPLARD